MKEIFIIILTLFSIELIGQDTADAIRLRGMSYMSIANNIDCDSTSGSNLEHRICLNIEFQKLDSIMNQRFSELLDRTLNDSIKVVLKENQSVWADNRRLQSEIIANGLQGHIFGIRYLHCMIESTKSRITELESILEIN